MIVTEPKNCTILLKVSSTGIYFLLQSCVDIERTIGLTIPSQDYRQSST